jgi:integrase
MKLTNIQCQSAKPAEKPKRIADGAGMYLEIMPNGSKYWRLKYRHGGKEKRLALGVYPEVSLADARGKRDAARKLLQNGIDPAAARQEEKRQGRLDAENTFESVAREWQEHQKARWTEQYGVYLLRRLELDIFPEIGNRPINTITAPQLLDTMRKIEKRGAHEIARRILQSVSQIFRYAIVTGRAERNPAADLKGALKPYRKGHYAALDSKDLPEFLRAVEQNDARLFVTTRNAMKLLMLTFVRTGELINAKWDEFDFEARQWTIPAERMKMRNSHIVPLSRQTLEILKAQRELTGQWEWVFPNRVHPRKPMSNNAVLKALERMGYKGRMTGHGFRALAMSTIKETLGYRHEVVDRQLAHAQRNKVDAAYDRAQFLPERRKMMQEWADHLDNASAINNVVKGKFGKVA